MDIVSFVMGMEAGKQSGGTDIQLIENIQIPVDFSNGDQFVEVPEGQAVKSAIIQKPETLVSENIAEGINIAGIVGTHSGAYSKEVLLEEQTVNNFAPATQFGGLYAGIVYQEIDFEVGKKYFVKWDSGEYEVTGQDVSAAFDVSGAVGIGNGAPFGLQGNNEPFAIIGALPNGTVILSYDTKTSHTFEIYKKVETGGGGSLPAGIYIGSSDLPYLGRYAQRFFKFNGQTYAIMNQNTTNSVVSIYRLDDGKWTKIQSDFDSGLARMTTSHNFIEYNGKMHIAGWSMKGHTIFDGTTAISATALPEECAAGALCVFDNKLLLIYRRNLYQWDETSDTWTTVCTFNALDSTSSSSIYPYEGNLYIYSYKKIYKITDFTNGSTELYTDCPVSFGRLIPLGNYFYYFNSGGISYKYDFENNVFYSLGKCPAFNIVGDFGDKVLVWNGTAGSSMDAGELAIIEEG